MKKQILNEEIKRMQFIAGILNEDNSQPLNELNPNVERLRGILLAKLDAVDKAYEDVHFDNDGLFDVDRGAREMYKKYFDEKEKTNKTWRELYNYIKGITPPKIEESIDIEKSVNEALKKFRNKK